MSAAPDRSGDGLAANGLAGLFTLAGVGLVVAALLYGCQRADDAYYAAQRDCVAAGGSFVPTKGDYTAACILGGRR